MTLDHVAIAWPQAGSFARYCHEHRLPLNGLDCPKGHHAEAAGHVGGGDEALLWVVVHVPSGRVVATVRGGTKSDVEWEPWAVDALGLEPRLSGRTEDGIERRHADWIRSKPRTGRGTGWRVRSRKRRRAA